MARISEYEWLQIESLLVNRDWPIDTGSGLFLMPAGDRFRQVFNLAVNPAMRENALNASGVEVAFDSSSSLRDVCQSIQTAQIIAADVSLWSADLAYVLGLAHAMGRCPLLIGAAPMDVPFNLMALRCVEYPQDDLSLRDLREHLTRAIRVFLAAAKASGDAQ